MPEKDDDTKKPASETVPDQRWKLQVFYLCFYGFMTQIRPGESFITPYLLGPKKNFTQAEVSRGQPVPPGVLLSRHDHHSGAGQSILLWSWVMEGYRRAASWARRVVMHGGALGREKVVWYGSSWQHAPVSLACKVTLSLKSQAQLSAP